MTSHVESDLETGDVRWHFKVQIPVEFGHVFACGAFAAGTFEPVRDFDASKGDRFVQSKDKASGLPLWVIEVIDADPEARTKTVRVKIAATVQPTLPPPLAGSPFTPVEFTGLMVTAAHKDGAIAYTAHELRHVCASLFASGASDMQVANQMGHSKIETTKNIYGHLFAQDRAFILKAINQAVGRLQVHEATDEDAA